MEWVTKTSSVVGAPAAANCRNAATTAADVGSHESGGVEVGTHVVNLKWHTKRVHLCGDVVAVLAAAGVRGVSRGDQGKHPATTGIGDLAQGVDGERMPVAVADDDRQLDALCQQRGSQRVPQRLGLFVDG